MSHSHHCPPPLIHPFPPVFASGPAGRIPDLAQCATRLERLSLVGATENSLVGLAAAIGGNTLLALSHVEIAGEAICVTNGWLNFRPDVECGWVVTSDRAHPISLRPVSAEPYTLFVSGGTARLPFSNSIAVF